MGKTGHISPSRTKNSLPNWKFQDKGRVREWSNYKKEMHNINSNVGEALQAENTEASILLISILSGSSEYCNAHGWTKTCSLNQIMQYKFNVTKQGKGIYELRKFNQHTSTDFVVRSCIHLKSVVWYTYYNWRTHKWCFTHNISEHISGRGHTHTS